MIETNEDIALKVAQQLRDVEEGQALAKAIAEGREVHPALLAQRQAAFDLGNQPAAETAAQAMQPEPAPPSSDPEATFRHVRLGIVAAMAVILLFLWLRQRKGLKPKH